MRNRAMQSEPRHVASRERLDPGFVMELLRLRCCAGSGRKVARLIMFRGLGAMPGRER